MLANQLIGELEIFCPNRACGWIGKLDSIRSHLPTCEFREGNLPPWFKAYVSACEDKLQKQDEKDEMFLEADELDRQNQERHVPLAMRLF